MELGPTGALHAAWEVQDEPAQDLLARSQIGHLRRHKDCSRKCGLCVELLIVDRNAEGHRGLWQVILELADDGCQLGTRWVRPGGQMRYGEQGNA